MSRVRFHKKKNAFRRGISALLCVTVCLIQFLFFPMGGDCAYGATRLRLSTAKSLAVANSDKIESLDIQIEAKKAARTSAVRSLRERERSMGTFRWSPLLNFKFPTTPNEAEAFEFQFKPTQLDYNITTLEHKMKDQKLTEYETVSNTYIDIITSTAEISFLQERIKTLSQTVLKNKARVITGLATEEQVKQQQKTLDGLKNDLASEKKTLLKAKEKMGKLVGFKVTSGYSFDEEFISTSMNEETVESLAAYAVDNDQTVFEAKQEMDLANMALEINYNLMKNHYGGNIKMISGYIEQIQSGSSVDKRAFKKDYDAFLKKIDEPWTGSWHILFFSFPKEWLKGDLDGVRYIQDDPYVLYSAALDYQAAAKEYENACEDLRSSVSDNYDGMMEARRDYQNCKEDLAEQKSILLEAEANNAIGKLSLEEYNTILDEYEASRSALKDSLSTYSKSLYSFDRLTCGAASAYFAEESLSTTAGSAGLGTPETDSGVDDELNRMTAIVEKEATYSIRSIVSTEEFILYIDIPENYEYTITDFELWADNRQIGARTSKDGSIRHLKIAVQEVDNVFIRLYNGDEFVDDCAIDPTVSYGPLNITTGYNTDDIQNNPVIGSFTVEDDSNIDMIRLRFTFDQNAVQREFSSAGEVAFYNMAAEKSLYLFTNDLVAKDDAFTYMSFIRNDLNKLTLRMFTSDGTYIGGAKLDPTTKNLYVDSEVTNEDMQRMAARQILIQEKAKDKTDEYNRILDLYNAAKAVSGEEADTDTITYYKNRLEELDAEIDAVGSTVTDNEIDLVIATRPTEVENMMETLAGESSEEGLSDEEVIARDTVLIEIAKKVIQQKRADEMTAEIETTITELQKELLKKTQELENLQKQGGVSDQVLSEKRKEIANLDAEIKSYENKKQFVSGDERSISDEELDKALKEYEMEIYAQAAPQLTDAMLYGSGMGQWALAYLEGAGIETTPENMRFAIQNADALQLIESLNQRLSALQGEYDKAIKNAETMEANAKNKDNTTKEADISCAKQLRAIADTYIKEMEAVKREIKRNDPNRSIILSGLESEKSTLNTEKEGLAKMVNLLDELSPYIELSNLQNDLKKNQQQYDYYIERAEIDLRASTTAYHYQVEIENINKKIDSIIKQLQSSSLEEALALLETKKSDLESIRAEYQISEDYQLKNNDVSALKKKCESRIQEIETRIKEINQEISDYK